MQGVRAGLAASLAAMLAACSSPHIVSGPGETNAPLIAAQDEVAAPDAASPKPSDAADTIGNLIADLPPEFITQQTPGASRAPDATPVATLPGPAAVPQKPASADGSLAAYLQNLRDVSCPTPMRRATPETIPLTVRRVSLQTINPGRRNVGALTFLGGFALDSDDDRFGGLSGLAVLEDGNLLSVSDHGAFVWIDLDRDGLAPVAARRAILQDENGNSLEDDPGGDAEGLAYLDGLALVSFERFHRVLAYDVGACGAIARGATLIGPGGVVSGAGGVLEMNASFDAAGIRVDANRGLESLAVTRDWYLFTGLETKAGDAGPLSARPVEAAADFSLRIGQGAPELVGLDVLPDGDEGGVRVFSLHRSTSALAGNAITLVETRFARALDQSNLPARVVSEFDERRRYAFSASQSRRLAELNVLFTIDNFEGIAARRMPDGRIRLYLVSDDNFSARQRTLLFVFDLPG